MKWSKRISNSKIFVYRCIKCLKQFVNDWFYDTKKVDPTGKAVLITGCDQGFGHILAKRLDSYGFQVFASCLNPTAGGAMELKKKCSKNLRILPLDVRKDESVQDAVQYVRNKLGTSKLFAVVNNAGIQRGISFEFNTLEDYKESLEVNALGMVRVTKAFLPMLREIKGRVVNMTSILGRIAVPHGSPYVMSKFAATGFNDSIRQELNVWGIKVICIEPELFATQLTDSSTIGEAVEEAIDHSDDYVMSLYGKEYLKRFKRYAETYMSYATPKLFLVVNAMESAVTMERPWPAYRPTRNFFTKFLIWDYELKMHISKDVITKFFFFVTNFPTPKAIDEAKVDEITAAFEVKNKAKKEELKAIDQKSAKQTSVQ